MTEIETVEAFLRALESLDAHRALSLASPDIVYQNVPLPPARGIEAFGKQMRWFERNVDRFEVRMHHIASNGPIVLTERTDIIEKAGLRVEPWVCGTFEVRDGRVVLWRDYFDWAQLTFGILRGLPRMAVQPLRRLAAG